VARLFDYLDLLADESISVYNDLSHPPTGYLSLLKPTSSFVSGASVAHVEYAFRSPDGSNYNPLVPALGQAGSPYARSVPSTHVIPKSALPDAGLVFDIFLRRKEFKSHPGGLSNFFFAFADLVIHSIFDTDHHSPTINNVSSYVDLSILYGSSDKEVDSVRRKDGTGMLWDDVFADNRLRFMPPSVGALLILFSRNHNVSIQQFFFLSPKSLIRSGMQYIARKILDINEWGTYSNPADEKRRIAQDDEIFNRAKLVNCGFFVQIVLGDYVGGILGLTRDGNPWRLNLVDVSNKSEISWDPIAKMHLPMPVVSRTWARIISSRARKRGFIGVQPSIQVARLCLRTGHKMDGRGILPALQRQRPQQSMF
jgi:hypothetical protein